jgi:alpha-L-rhamnosidase/Glycosyl hydrolases family 2, sugar binding domain
MTDSTKLQGKSILQLDLLTRREVVAGGLAIGIAAAVDPVFAVDDSPDATPSKEALARIFKDPPREYAPIDNWWWEAGHLDNKKITWQLQEFKDKGSAGTWFYPRWVYGESLSSDPPYWSQQWWDFTRFAAEEHKRLGLTSWCSNWTQMAFQQNLVRAEKTHNRALDGKSLAIYRLESDAVLEIGPEDEILEAASYRKIGSCLDYSSRSVLTDSIRNHRLGWRADGPDWLLTVIVARPWDLDYLSKDVGERFSGAFLGEYAKRLPEFLGNTLEGFGDDEILLLKGHILFSHALLSKVKAERGYDPTALLIGLFHDIGQKTDQIRCDYYDAMCALLEENFYKPSRNWLEQHGMKYGTVSQIGPGDPLLQTYQVGDHFRYMRTYHMTGNEDPNRAKVGERRLMATKLSSSVAHLYGRQRVVVLAYYSAGWGMTQQDNLAWTNENFTKGMNWYLTHSALYTLMGGWYEWVPPTNPFYQPSWRYWRAFTDYVKRLSFILSQGKHRADVALLYPLTTIHAGWTADRKDWSFKNDEFEREGTYDAGTPPFDQTAIDAATSLRDLAGAIFHDGIDFDFIDNSSLEGATVKADVLKVAGVEFRCVVLPRITTIRLASMAKIRDFYNDGGTVVAFGRVPTASAENGRGDPELRSIVETVFGAIGEDGVPISGKQASGRGGKSYFVPHDAKHVPDVISEAIVRDVATAEKGLFHTHQKLGKMDVYFLFNVRDAQRELSIRFRVEGEAEIWNAFTGESRRLHRLRRNRGTTDVRLRMGPNEGVLLVFSPDTPGPSVVEDDITELVSIDVRDRLALQGFDATGGYKTVRIEYRGREYAMHAQVDAAPRKIEVTGPFSFHLEPTMDNRWGDFRYPSSSRTIGAEARRFRYLEESEVLGTDLGYHTRSFDDSQWKEVTFSYGPYWLRLGPFQRGLVPKDVIEQARRGVIDRPLSLAEGRMRWERLSFSKKFGYFADRKPTLDGDDNWLDSDLLGVRENFLVLDQPAPGNDTHYLYSNVLAPEDGAYILCVGVAAEKPAFSSLPPSAKRTPTSTRIWINASEVPLQLEKKDLFEFRTGIRLRKGSNAVLLEVVRPEEGPVALYAVFLHSEPPEEDRYVPLLRWFKEPQRLVFDVMPPQAKRVGWYRFLAPPGVRAIHLQSQATAMHAWIDGKPASIEGGKILLSPPRRDVSQVALRVEQERGSYAGAVFQEPVAFECEVGQVALGDWSKFGLSTYSGIGVYTKDIELENTHLKGKVILNLGDARSVAEVFINGHPAGIGMARPFRFDITDFVKVGFNRLEVKVANTLANHMSSYPTKWVLEGQTTSGLLGPVTLEFPVPISMRARL